MIFSALKQLGIPYLVVKYKISFMGDNGAIVGRYKYEIITENDLRLHRLGFFPDKSMTHKGEKLYVFRRLTEREVRVFLSYNIPPTFRSADGLVWELNGVVRRRPRTKRNRDEKGRYR